MRSQWQHGIGSILLALILSPVILCPATAKPETHKAPSVVLLGGDFQAAFANGLKAAGLRDVKISQHNDLVSRIAMIAAADVVVLLVNSPDGPMPLTRDDALFCGLFATGTMVIGLAGLEEMDDTELLELVEMETRELMNMFNLPGDEAHVITDGKSYYAESHDFARAVSLLNGMPPRMPLKTITRSPGVYKAVISSDIKMRHHSKKGTVKTENYTISFGIDSGPVQLIIGPGKEAVFEVKFQRPIKVPENAAFVLIKDNRVAATGVLEP